MQWLGCWFMVKEVRARFNLVLAKDNKNLNTFPVLTKTEVHMFYMLI